MPQTPDAQSQTSASAATLALAALGWLLEDGDRAERYLSLTGLDPDSLREGLGDPTVLASCLDFLANYEPDLIRAAEALAVTPEELIAARASLSQKAN
ncbi:MAG: DUF3572 family protein [Pseudomonadota bacterium]